MSLATRFNLFDYFIVLLLDAVLFHWPSIERVTVAQPPFSCAIVIEHYKTISHIHSREEKNITHCLDARIHMRYTVTSLISYAISQ